MANDGYSRQAQADITPGEVVKAGPINQEFNQLESAFNATSGHTHDGTSEKGALVPLISDVDGDTRIHTETSTDEDVIRHTVAGTNVLVNEVTTLRPSTGVTFDLGTTSETFSKMFADTIAVSNINVSTGLTFTPGASVDANGVEFADAGDPTAPQSLVTLSHLQTQLENQLKLSSTSTSTVTITTATATFVLADNLSFSQGAHIIAQATADNWVFGEILEYTTASQTVKLNVEITQGSGTYSDWAVNVSGVAGAVALTGTATGLIDMGSEPFRSYATKAGFETLTTAGAETLTISADSVDVALQPIAGDVIFNIVGGADAYFSKVRYIVQDSVGARSIGYTYNGASADATIVGTTADFSSQAASAESALFLTAGDSKGEIRVDAEIRTR